MNFFCDELGRPGVSPFQRLPIGRFDLEILFSDLQALDVVFKCLCVSRQEALLQCGTLRSSFFKQVQIRSHLFYGETAGAKTSKDRDDASCLGRVASVTAPRISRNRFEEANLLIVS